MKNLSLVDFSLVWFGMIEFALARSKSLKNFTFVFFDNNISSPWSVKLLIAIRQCSPCLSSGLFSRC